MQQMRREFATVESQVAALNTQLARTVALQNGVDAAGFENMATAAAANSKAFRNAAASTGMFEVQQLRMNRATDDYIKKLNAQKLSFREMARQSKIARAAYREQLAMENMLVRSNPGSVVHGKQVLDVAYAKEVSSELDTAGRRMAFLNQELKSGAHQMVNWGKNTQWAGRQLMVGFTMPILAVGAAAGVLAYQMDKEFTRIAKVYDTTANAGIASAKGQMAVEKELQQLREDGTRTAIESAKEYGSAATDTLNVQAELAATGQKGAELQKATAEVMRISRLGELEYQDAINTTISLQSVFRMSSEKLTETFNFMNSVENSTSLATADFAAAIPIAAAPVKEFGGDIQELGVLLTAMKSRGIEATQGANAIKAAMQRLGRPSAQVQEEWKAITGTDITQMFENSTSLIDLFGRISEATKDLSNKDRIKAFAGLFGTYQVTRMSALVDGMQDLNDATTQTGKAYQLAQGDASQWAAVADREIERYQESISGRWQTAFENMKIQLSTLGEPFIEVATIVVQGVSWIIEKFNAMPKAGKILAAIGISAAALAGPLVMLGGLIANLTGNLLKGIAAFGGLFVKMDILDVESRAAKMAAGLAEAGFIDERTAVQQLTAEINKLALAQEAANSATLQANELAVTAAGAATRQAQATAMVPPRGPGGTMLYGGMTQHGPQLPTKVVNGVTVPDTERFNAAVAAGAVQREELRTQSKITAETEKTAVAQGRNRKLLDAGALSASAMAAGMALSMTNSNGMANAIGDTLMLAAITVPAAESLWPLMKKAATASWSFAAAQLASTSQMVAQQGLLGGSVAKAKQLASAFMAMMGPVGWVTLAITAIGVSLYKINKDQEEATRKAAELQDTLAQTASAWASNMGLARKEMEMMPHAGVADSGKYMDAYQQDLAFYSEGGAGEAQGEAFGKLDDAEKFAKAMTMFVQLQKDYGVSADRARVNVAALFEAAGDGAFEAGQKAGRLAERLGELKNMDWGEAVAAQMRVMDDAVSRVPEGMFNNEDELQAELEKQAKVFGETWVYSFEAATNPKQAQARLDELGSVVSSKWQTIFEQMTKYSDRMRDYFAENNIKSGADFAKFYHDNGDIIDNGVLMDAFGTERAKQWKTAIEGASNYESVISGVVGEMEGMGSEITTLIQLQNSWNVKARAMSYDEVRASAQKLLNVLAGGGGLAGMISEPFLAFNNALPQSRASLESFLETADPQQLADFEKTVTEMALAKNIKVGKDALETYLNILYHVKNETKNVANETSRIADEWTATGEEMSGVYQSAMEGVQQQMADDYMDSFDQQMDNSLEARQDMWDNRADALDRQIAQRERELDHKWEQKRAKEERYWDNRTDAVNAAMDAEQKAEDQRQKMFDAEIARLNKLNEMYNRNIDFNVALSEGNFDEAAKIRNDASASADASILERAADKGSEKSEQRLDRLQQRLDKIDKAREKAMKRLDREEERERRHLERISEMRRDALQQQMDDDMEAMQDMWDARKDALQKQLDLFTSWIGKNEKEIRRHWDQVGLSINDFEDRVIKPKSTTWGKYFGDGMRDGIREAGSKLASDKIWETMGKRSTKSLLKGMGFDNMDQFRAFVMTGKFPKGMKGDGGTRGTSYGDDHRSEFRHEGGWVGSGPGSRKGVARTTRGLHSSERGIIAQNGEYVVDRKTAAKNPEALEQLSKSGNIGFDKPHGGGGPGVAGLMTGMLQRGLLMGFQKSLGRAYRQKINSLTAGNFGTAGAGVYGDLSFDSAQLKNAATIASVGRRMGMSKRDIEIGIMTAITESGLRNVNYGDRDSLGLFQQRPSMGWGSEAQVTNPEYAAGKFFSVLKGITNRGAMTPWMAAQSVQRSAYSDGSNYRPNWNEAEAIFAAMKAQAGRGGGAQYAAGPGGWRKPAPGGYAWSNTHDYAVPRGTPLYAVSDGSIVESRAITSGGSPGNGLYTKPYRSYGETLVLRTKGGDLFRYAHMSPGTRMGLGDVKGGTMIGRSGETGNAWGAHVHFDVNGNYDARGWLNEHGIHLKKGAREVRWDNTIANLHKGEGVLTRDMNTKFKQGVDNFANGGNNEYNINVNVEGTDASAEEIANAVVKVIDRRDARKPGSRKR